jgi:CheY-like chemotaxis protein
MREVDILLVEDDPAVQSSFASSLAVEGFRVASAVDGLAAIA